MDKQDLTTYTPRTLGFWQICGIWAYTLVICVVGLLAVVAGYGGAVELSASVLLLIALIGYPSGVLRLQSATAPRAPAAGRWMLINAMSGAISGSLGSSLGFRSVGILADWFLFFSILGLMGLAFGIGWTMRRYPRSVRLGRLGLLVVCGAAGWLAGALVSATVMSFLDLTGPVVIVGVGLGAICGGGLAIFLSPEY